MYGNTSDTPRRKRGWERLYEKKSKRKRINS
jgi:hypothetical protein